MSETETVTQTDDTGNNYRYESRSGQTYAVQFAGRPEDGVETWRCDCPARKTCRHIDRVSWLVDQVDQGEDPDGFVPFEIGGAE